MKGERRRWQNIINWEIKKISLPFNFLPSTLPPPYIQSALLGRFFIDKDLIYFLTELFLLTKNTQKANFLLIFSLIFITPYITLFPLSFTYSSSISTILIWIRFISIIHKSIPIISFNGFIYVKTYCILIYNGFSFFPFYPTFRLIFGKSITLSWVGVGEGDLYSFFDWES